jgi:hypothetical protein
MRKAAWMTVAIFCALILILSAAEEAAAKARANNKVSKCLKEKECLFFVSGSMTQDPKMSLLVLDKVWKTFLDKDRHDLREMLKKKIKEANDKPEKYVHVSKKAANYDTLKRNIQGMRSYSVFLSHGKDRKGVLGLDEEIMVNY